ncbi:MAG TPA: hypothetical protein VLM89_15295, partial [Phycisphaerae bacterium]|nr:hypothetical protein [Phycisphaerae bacterium]
MTQGRGTLAVYSETEARLYFWVARCGRCSGRPMISGPVEAHSGGQILTVPVTCRACGSPELVRFDAGGFVWREPNQICFRLPQESWDAPPLPINPTEDPSRVIDVADWLTLEAMIRDRVRQAAEQADTMADRTAVRQWQIL